MPALVVKLDMDPKGGGDCAQRLKERKQALWVSNSAQENGGC